MALVLLFVKLRFEYNSCYVELSVGIYEILKNFIMFCLAIFRLFYVVMAARCDKSFINRLHFYPYFWSTLWFESQKLTLSQFPKIILKVPVVITFDRISFKKFEYLSNNFIILKSNWKSFILFEFDSNGGAKVRKNVSSSATSSVIEKENSKLSSPSQQKLEVGSPISSSLSSYSRIKVSKMANSMSSEYSKQFKRFFLCSILHRHSMTGTRTTMTMRSNQTAQRKLNVNEKRGRKRKRRKAKRRKGENAINLFQVSKISPTTTQC